MVFVQIDVAQGSYDWMLGIVFGQRFNNTSTEKPPRKILAIMDFQDSRDINSSSCSARERSK
jgi:hypothetical protein